MNETMRNLKEGVEKMTRSESGKAMKTVVADNKTPVFIIPSIDDKFRDAMKILGITEKNLSGFTIDAGCATSNITEDLGKNIIIAIAENGGDSKFTQFSWVISDDLNHPQDPRYAQIAMYYWDKNMTPHFASSYVYQPEINPVTEQDFNLLADKMAKMFGCFMISSTEEFLKKVAAIKKDIEQQQTEQKKKEEEIIIDSPAKKVSGYDTNKDDTMSTSIVVTSVDDIVDVDDNEIKSVDDIVDVDDNEIKSVDKPEEIKEDKTKNSTDSESDELDDLLNKHDKLYPTYHFKKWIQRLSRTYKKDFSEDEEFMTNLRNVVNNPIPKSEYYNMGPDNYIKTVRCGY